MTNRTPRHPSIICLVQPALVDVQDDLVLNVRPQESLRPCLTLMDVQERVHVQRLLPNPAVPQPQILFEHRDDEALGDIELVVLQDEISELPCAGNLITFGAELYHRVHHNFLVVCMLFLLLDHQADVVLVLLGAKNHLTERVGLDGVSLGHILDGTTVDYNLSKHFDLFAAAVTGQLLHRMHPGRSRLVRCFPGR